MARFWHSVSKFITSRRNTQTLFLLILLSLSFFLLRNYSYHHQSTKSVPLLEYSSSPFPLPPPPSAVVNFNSSSVYDGRCSLSDATTTWHPEAVKSYSKILVHCGAESLSGTAKFKGIAFTVIEGHLLHQKVNLAVVGLSCCYRPFHWKSHERYIKYNSCIPITDPVTNIPVGVDFAEVLCHDDEKTLRYRDAFAFVHAQKVEPISITTSQRLNVIILGFDSTSRLNFLRQLPLSSQYLFHQLDATVLEGYSVVGSGSAKNLVPLLTGLSLAELNRGCAVNDSLDTCPFLFTNFSRKLGYITSFAEDWPEFQGNTFRDPPTTFYLRPYTLLMGEEHTYPKWIPYNVCYGPRLVFEVMINYAVSVGQLARRLQRPHLHYHWITTLAHEKTNGLGLADQPLLQFLMKFKDSEARNDTALLLLGDHGRGDVDYWLPAAFMVLPPWFPQKYPQHFANLRGNRRKLVTSFDMHETIKDLMDELPNKYTLKKQCLKIRGISLFENIPSRNCFEAGISLKWCNLCYPSISVSPADPLVKIAVSAIKQEIEKRIKPSGDKCLSQRVLRVVGNASKWDPRDVARELCNVKGITDVGEHYADYTTMFLNVSCDPQEDLVELVELTLEMCPYNATYHGQVLIIKKAEESNQQIFTLLTDQLIREDTYRFTGSCVAEKVKPYCICREKVHHQNYISCSLPSYGMWPFLVVCCILFWFLITCKHNRSSCIMAINKLIDA